MVMGVLATLEAMESDKPKADRHGPGTTMRATDVYLALGMDIYKWETIAAILRGGGYCQVGVATITLLPPGRKLGQKINEAIANSDAKKMAEGMHGKFNGK